MKDLSILKAQLKAQLDELVQTRFDQEVITNLTNLFERDPLAITWVLQLQKGENPYNTCPICNEYTLENEGSCAHCGYEF